MQYYYSLFNPVDMQSMVWAFVQPVHHSIGAEIDLQNGYCSPMNALSGSTSQESRDLYSPRYF